MGFVICTFMFMAGMAFGFFASALCMTAKQDMGHVRVYISSGRADGEMGPYTVNAVKLFRAHAGILSDGEIGGDTWRELMRGD